MINFASVAVYLAACWHHMKCKYHMKHTPFTHKTVVMNLRTTTEVDSAMASTKVGHQIRLAVEQLNDCIMISLRFAEMH